MIDLAYRARLVRTDPAYLARLEAADVLEASFAADLGVREMKWTDRNLTTLLRATGERPGRVAEARALLCELSRGHRAVTWGSVRRQASLGCGGVFDHPTMWGRGRQPLAMVGHPYDVRDEHRAALDYLARTFPTLRVAVDDRPSFYGFGTHHVRIELAGVLPPFRTPPATRKTRKAAHAARKAFAEAMADDPEEL